MGRFREIQTIFSNALGRANLEKTLLEEDKTHHKMLN